MGRVRIKEKFFEFSKYFILLAFVLHTFALVLRINRTGHAPMFTMYETLLYFSWTVFLLILIVIFKYKDRYIELIAMPAGLLILTGAMMNESVGRKLPLVLRTHWFETHVMTSFTAYGFFLLSACGALLFLINKKFNLFEEKIEKNFETVCLKSILWGFMFFSVSMFSGAIWAYLAWAKYWLWDPKVLWSFLLWFYFAGAMHAWFMKKWRGRGLAVASIIGFILMMFTYLGVSVLMKSSHSF